MIARFNLASKLERLELLPWVLTPSTGENITTSFQLITRWMSAAIVESFTSLYSLSQSKCMHGMKYHFSILISNKVSQTSECFDEKQRLYLRSKTTENNN